MKKHNLVCILCPKGCSLTAVYEGGEWIVNGNSCKRGHEYAIQEMICPKRTVTSSVWVDKGDYKLLSVKTDRTIPREKIDQVLAQLAKVHVLAPIDAGDVIIENVAGTGANIVATRKIKEV